MAKLKNTGKGDLYVRVGNKPLAIQPNQSIDIDDRDLEGVRKNPVSAAWISDGRLVVVGGKREKAASASSADGPPQT